MLLLMHLCLSRGSLLCRRPRDFPCKALDSETEQNLEETVHSAIRQILDKKYAAALHKKCSRENIRIYGFAFRGKEVFIDGGDLEMAEKLVKR